ncbi:hypothetical protein ISG33_12140 [Glaciecola sp. MH2013]|uniref:hypothetical protein n=1 Tax=Glaciecola sp. MH2013 TaxID=2785524 RepID=UPI00189CD0DD|nr:hypothetical protein [Glaciecola sp. MH2013]MBF7074151.1 hypothetical protein [Glaciecola sp. MH2013]
MFDWLSQSNYLIMTVQLVVTLLFVPLLSYQIFSKTALNYGVGNYPEASKAVHQYLNKTKTPYWTMVGFLFAFVAVFVIQAIRNETELLNWDDQSGLLIMYLLAMIPVAAMMLIHKALFNIIKNYAGSKRTASLRPRKLQHYLSLPLLVLIAVANIVFVGTIVYFVANPFDGFAGYTNLVGLFVLNGVFFGIIWAVFRDDKTGNFSNPDHRDAFKRKAIHVNMLILAFALMHISLSIWIAGSELREYKLITQSLYLQLTLIIAASMLTLPRTMFKKNSD